ncbi:uncharacterized protein LACBIDRAFT_316934 [Laccaria bicolor S238N-H82]|uniref:Predicted protein n=1 Tax=Laccaria bicolor (strain S238N-H82 / ATCC MYA-4686) TaxID=486041 RepID=B0D5B0_LACBS|nr:uncharacterized protein LACBIDRAFT_316934 [Laccaria bicolor S238N-H82]EDR10489.1 predicted protein [Laccaria bicolor S238N-H82]|eukprot:XP_001878939.1 predicted protein [Laccaria bicolor S238N-H82]
MTLLVLSYSWHPLPLNSTLPPPIAKQGIESRQFGTCNTFRKMCFIDWPSNLKLTATVPRPCVITNPPMPSTSDFNSS